MQIQGKHITKFIRIYKKHFGKTLSKDEVYEKTSKLLLFMKTIYKPMTKEELEMVKKRQEHIRYPQNLPD